MNHLDEQLSPWKQAQQEFDCAHEQTHPVRFTKVNGAVCVRIQCRRCGASFGEKPKANYPVDQLPEWDEALRQGWEQQVQHRYEELNDDRLAAWEARHRRADEEWQARYARYLESEHWRNLRQFVLTRDGHRCQNCGRPVVGSRSPVADRAEVHHTTYVGFRRLGKSFAFECVTLCHACHRAYHGMEYGDDEAEWD